MSHKPEVLKKIRISFGYNKSEFALKLGMTFATISGWEAGRRSPSFSALRKMIQLAKDENKLIDFDPLLNIL